MTCPGAPERVPTFVKICGLRRPEDALAAGEAGADAVGLVFHPPSPRCVTLEEARAVVAALPPFVAVVGLFVDPEPEAVVRALNEVSLDLLQFHGRESAALCGRFGRRYLKTLHAAPGVDLAAAAAPHAQAAGILLDAYVPGQPGGTGRRVTLARLPDIPRPVILAGGLDPDNVADAMRTLRPHGVDVSSGVESRPGVKDPARIRAFVAAVREAGRDAV
jgi:phosphoribosylanthranilate isomerase